jgi:hypothetical protein
MMSANKHVALSGELFFTNKAPFFSTISDHIKFTATEHIASRKLAQLVRGSQHVQALHAAQGFQVKHLLMDGEFVPLKHELASRGIVLNTTSANEHVPKIERQIRVIKEHVRVTRHTLPFKVLPLTMLIELVCSSIQWINASPPPQRRRIHQSEPEKYNDRHPIRLQQALPTSIWKLCPSPSRT